MKLKEKQQAIRLRKKGFSLKEIAGTLKVAKSSVSLWVRDTKLSLSAQQQILRKMKKGQIVAQQTLKSIRLQKERNAHKQAQKIISKFISNQESNKIICAMLFWCEGTKSVNESVSFTNSDSNLIQTFLSLLRKSYCLNELKFRVSMHLHEYHVEADQLKFWSEASNIPASQFTKTFWKKHTGKRIRDGYEGCIRVRYFDVNIARELHAIAQAYMGL